MPAGDPVLTRELKALQDDVSTSQRQRRSRRKSIAERPADATAAAPDATAPAPVAAAAEHAPDDSPAAQDLRRQLGELLDEATGFFEQADKNIAAHPTASVLGALVVGILIGRLLGRR